MHELGTDTFDFNGDDISACKVRPFKNFTEDPFGDVEVAHLPTVLIQYGALWVLEKGVIERIACLTFFLYLFG